MNLARRDRWASPEKKTLGEDLVSSMASLVRNIRETFMEDTPENRKAKYIIEHYPQNYLSVLLMDAQESESKNTFLIGLNAVHTINQSIEKLDKEELRKDLEVMYDSLKQIEQDIATRDGDQEEFNNARDEELLKFFKKR